MVMAAPEARPARRYFVARELVEALPQRARARLIGFVSILLARSRTDHDLWADRVVVDTARPQLAAEAGVSVDTVKRWERELAQAGVCRRVAGDRRTRVLELLEPRFADDLEAAHRADRARAEHPRPEGRRGSERGMGAPLSGAPMPLSQSPIQFSEGERERSRCAHEAPGSARPHPSARTAQGDIDPSVEVARAILGRIHDRLRAECRERRGPARAWSLSRGQTEDVRSAVETRVRTLRGCGAGSLAVEAVRGDVDRVLAYAVERERPAAYVHHALRGGDWRSEVVAGSTAAEVREAGPERERPVLDLGSREGVPSDPLATPAELEALERALDAAGAGERHRRVAARLQRRREVRQLTLRLGEIALAQEVGS